MDSPALCGLKRLAAEERPADPLVRFHPPFGFLGDNRLQLGAPGVLSDSGQGCSSRSSGGWAPEVPVDYRVTNTSERVVNFILSTAGSHRVWSGLR